MPGVAPESALWTSRGLQEKWAWRRGMGWGTPRGAGTISEFSLFQSKGSQVATRGLRACPPEAAADGSSEENKLKGLPSHQGVRGAARCPQWAAGCGRGPAGGRREASRLRPRSIREGGGQDACPLSSVLPTWEAPQASCGGVCVWGVGVPAAPQRFSPLWEGQEHWPGRLSARPRFGGARPSAHSRAMGLLPGAPRY